MVTDPQFYRTGETEMLQGNAAKAREVLGWVPKIGLVEIIKEMVADDMKRLEGTARPL